MGQGKPGLGLGLGLEQRVALLGRLRMAELIEMPERDFARQVEEVEKDPLFRKLFFGSEGLPGAIRRQRWPRARLSSSFYEFNEGLVAGGERVQVEKKLAGRQALVSRVQAMGVEAFERYFLHAEEGLPQAEIARRTGLQEAEVRQVLDLLLEIGVEEEFAPPPADPGLARPCACVAAVALDGEEPVLEFFTPYWARGTYQIRYDLLEEWKRAGTLALRERRRLRHLLKRLETLNLRQSTMFRVLETLVRLHADYLRTRREDRRSPISLRGLARRLDLAPSTVCRAFHGRCLRLPWGREVGLSHLTPGRHGILREVLGRWLAAPGRRPTDLELARRMGADYGIRVSRRTVNGIRHELQGEQGSPR